MEEVWIKNRVLCDKCFELFVSLYLLLYRKFINNPQQRGNFLNLNIDLDFQPERLSEKTSKDDAIV